MIKAKIKSIEYYLPKIVIDNEEINKTADIAPSFIENQLGIKNRHFLGKEETCTTMAIEAIKKMRDSNVDIDEVDSLIVVNQTPDYQIPGIAPLIQAGAGLKKNIAAFDMNLACSGFTYALLTASSQIHSGLAKKVLIITTEAYSKRINLKDKTVASLFGDAATATLIEETEDDSGIVSFDFGTDGERFKNLYVPAGGTVNPIANDSLVEKEIENGIIRADNNLIMDGKEIFSFVLENVPASVKKCLESGSLKTEEIDYFVLHQANKYMLEVLNRKLKVAKERYIIDLFEYGNTVSSTIPIILSNLLKDNKIVKGNTILMSGFGVGLSLCTCIYKH